MAIFIQQLINESQKQLYMWQKVCPIVTSVLVIINELVL